MRRSPVLGDYGLPVGGASRGGRASVRSKSSGKAAATKGKIAIKYGKAGTHRGVKFDKPTKHSSTKEVFKDSDVRRQAASRGMGRYLREGLNITERTRMRQFAKKFNTDKGIMRQSSTMQERTAFLDNMRRSGAKVSKNMKEWVKLGARTKPTINEKADVNRAPDAWSKRRRRQNIIKGRQARERDNVREASEARSERVGRVRKQMVEAAKKSGGDERVRTRSPKVKGKKALGFDKQMDSQAAKSPSGTAKLAVRKRLGKAQAGKQKAQKAMARTSSADRTRKGGFSFYD